MRRLDRQLILTRENPPMLWHVLHEGVLAPRGGQPHDHAGQLDKLADLAHEPGMVIQVLPFLRPRACQGHQGPHRPRSQFQNRGVAEVHQPGKGGRTKLNDPIYLSVRLRK